MIDFNVMSATEEGKQITSVHYLHLHLCGGPSWCRPYSRTLGSSLKYSAADKLTYNTGRSKPRTCIVYNKNINLLPIPKICSDDLVAALLFLRNNSDARVVNCFSLSSWEKSNPTKDLTGLVEYNRWHRAELLVGCDLWCQRLPFCVGQLKHQPQGLLYDIILSNCTNSV